MMLKRSGNHMFTMYMSREYRGAWIYDQNLAADAENLLKAIRPGAYLLSNGDSVAMQYFKMDKSSWLSKFTHDYTVAVLRKDGSVEEALRNAYSKLAEALDWEEKNIWGSIRGNLKLFAEKSVDILFNLYKEKLRVEGWRRREEALNQAKHSLLMEPSDAGDLFRMEYGRMLALAKALRDFAADVRMTDRVAFWTGEMVEEKILRELYGDAAYEHLTYLDDVLESVISGQAVDGREDASMWWACLALRSVEEHIAEGVVGRTEAEDYMLMASMALEGFEANPDPGVLEAYLADLVERLKLRTVKSAPDMLRLYYRAKHGPMGREDVVARSLFKEWEDMDERERRCRVAQMTAGMAFVRGIITVMQFLREKYGYSASRQLDKISERMFKLAIEVQRKYGKR